MGTIRVKGDRFINLSPFTLDTQPVPYEIDILPGCKVSFF